MRSTLDSKVKISFMYVTTLHLHKSHAGASLADYLLISFFVQLSFHNLLMNITVKVTKIHIFIIIHVDRSLHDELHTEFNLVTDLSDGSNSRI